MKYIYTIADTVRTKVALFTRAWIEINTTTLTKQINLVALFTRAWIEIIKLAIR